MRLSDPQMFPPKPGVLEISGSLISIGRTVWPVIAHNLISGSLDGVTCWSNDPNIDVNDIY
jgi:hypothetical protein